MMLVKNVLLKYLLLLKQNMDINQNRVQFLILKKPKYLLVKKIGKMLYNVKQMQ